MEPRITPPGVTGYLKSGTNVSTRLLEKLDAVKSTGSNRWQARCPAHDDKTPSLTVTQIVGQVLLHCHAGCQTQDVLASLNLTLAALYDNPKGSQYDYRKLGGTVVRTVYRSPEKQFRQKVIDKTTVPLFHLDKVTAAVTAGEPIYITEGEKDTIAAEYGGVTATTAPMGASNWHKADYEPLRGAARVVIVADRDNAGKKRAAGLLAHLGSFGIGALSVVVPAVGNDLADHIGAGHTIAELVPYIVTTVPAVEAEPRARTTGEEVRRQLVTPAGSIRTEQQVFFWKARIPTSTISIFAGRGGEGKSTFAFNLLALTTLGQVEGTWFGKPQPTLVWSGEDRWETVIIPRLKAARANLDLVFKLSIESVLDEETNEASPNFPQDLHLVKQAIEDTGAKLVMLDPVTSTMSGDLNKVADTRRTFDGLARIAHETGAVILCIMHFNKGAGNVSEKLSGSHAFRDAARSVFVFATDEETGNRVLSQDKNNYAQGSASSLAFTLESVDIPTDDGNFTAVARVVMQGESDVSVSDLLNRGNDSGEDHEDRNAAQAFVLDFIQSRPDWEAPAVDVLKAGRLAGFSDTAIKHARKRCKNPSIASVKSAFSGGWVWAVTPEGATEGAQGASSRERGTFGTLGANSGALGDPDTHKIIATADACAVHGTPMWGEMCGRCEAGVEAAS